MVSQLQPIDIAPRGVRIWAWGDNWNWSEGNVAYIHEDYNGHKDVVCRDGRSGPPFRIGGKDAPTHWAHLPSHGDDQYQNGRSHGYTSGYYAAIADALNYLNTLEDRSVEKKTVYAALMEMRPPLLEPPASANMAP